MLILLPETYQPVLVEQKARHLKITRPHHNLKATLKVNLTRPTIMFFTEPILFLLSLYMAFVYGILYLDFTAYPYVFQQTRYWETGISGLAFLGNAYKAQLLKTLLRLSRDWSWHDDSNRIVVLYQSYL